MAAHVLLTLAAATSFLVDIREGTSTSSAEKYGCCSIAFFKDADAATTGNKSFVDRAFL
jgi:hypothetical protein